MSEWAVQMTGVGKAYKFFSLNDVDLEVPAGHIMGFIGANGAGKSTTIRILMGLVHQDRGEVRVFGRPMPADQAAAKWDIGFASEDMRLYDGPTLDWHMRFVRSIYPSWDQAYAQTLLRRFDLRAEQRIKGLSHGQRVKATLLLVLARRPRLLVLDEPTTGLDPVARHEVLRELTEVMRDDGRSVLFSSHNTLDVEQIFGPDWLASTRFEVSATMPENALPDTLSAMMLALLEDRFKMKSHRESREFPVYALEVSDPAKLVKSTDEIQAEAAYTVSSGSVPGGISVDLGQGASLLLGNNRFEAKRVPMVTLAATLERFVERQVVDMTKLEGRYNVTFELTPEDFQAAMMRSAVAAGITLPPQAMQLLDKASPAAVPDALKAIGFTLTARRAPIEVLVIDSMERLPTEN